MLLEHYPRLVRAVSTTSDGNMSLLRGKPEVVLGNRRKFLESFGINPESVVSTYLQHGNEIARVSKTDFTTDFSKIHDRHQADGLITNEPGTTLLMIVGDCPTISLYDPENNAIGLVHTGWKGLNLRTLTQAVKSMNDHFHTQPSQLIAELSPSIGPCCYKPADPNKTSDYLKPYVQKFSGGEYSLDIWTSTENQLQEAGVLGKNIYNPKVCTYHDGNYYSHRKAVLEGLEDFRFAVILGIK